MSRKTRVLQKRFVVFCEGDTEYNYIEKMRKNQGVELVLKPINMHGGGYSNFLQKIKTESQSNYLAKFIIMDADRIATVQGELDGFKKLLDNRYEIKKKNFDIVIKDTFFDVDLINKKCSNIEEFFNVIDW